MLNDYWIQTVNILYTSPLLICQSYLCISFFSFPSTDSHCNTVPSTVRWFQTLFYFDNYCDMMRIGEWCSWAPATVCWRPIEIWTAVMELSKPIVGTNTNLLWWLISRKTKVSVIFFMIKMLMSKYPVYYASSFLYLLWCFLILYMRYCSKTHLSCNWINCHTVSWQYHLD